MTPELKIAIAIAKQVNKLIMKNFQHLSKNGRRLKKHGEIVTNVDLAANQYITRELLKHFPIDDIVSEEAKKINNPGARTWHVDPLDGTTNFAYGFMNFAACLGLEDEDGIQLGVIGLPVLDQVFYAEKNQGAWRGKHKLSVSKEKNLAKAMVLVCRGHSPAGRKRFHEFFNRLIKKNVGHIRHFAAAGIELSAVAAGQADGCVMADVHPWDVIAGVVLIREAGGKVTNWQGEDWQINDTTLVASNGIIHLQIIQLTKGIK